MADPVGSAEAAPRPRQASPPATLAARSAMGSPSPASSRAASTPTKQSPAPTVSTGRIGSAPMRQHCRPAKADAPSAPG